MVDCEQIANECMTQEKKASIYDVFCAIKQKIESNGIDFKFMIPPQKNEVLIEADEQFPVNRPSENAYFKMQDMFETGKLASNYVNVVDALRKYNEVASVFYQTDFHWNDWGAAVAFGELINSYSDDIGLGNVYSLDDFEFSTFMPGYNDAQLASLSVLKYDIPEEITVNKPMDYYSPIIADDRYKDYVIWENSEKTVFDKAVLFIGDSYTPPALYDYHGTHSGIVELFPKVYFCHWNYAKGALNDIPEDVGLVVVEAIESIYYRLDDQVGQLLVEK